jgi:hypothetical protein
VRTAITARSWLRPRAVSGAHPSLIEASDKAVDGADRLPCRQLCESLRLSASPPPPPISNTSKPPPTSGSQALVPLSPFEADRSRRGDPCEEFGETAAVVVLPRPPGPEADGVVVFRRPPARVGRDRAACPLPGVMPTPNNGELPPPDEPPPPPDAWVRAALSGIWYSCDEGEPGLA